MKSRIISDSTELDEIIRKCEFCSFGMVDENNEPYVLHFNFGYEGNTVYMHGHPEGKKISTLNNNNKVCLFFSSDHAMYHQNENVACSFVMRYRSVIIFGQSEFVEDNEEKIKALNIIMKQYTGKDDYKYHDPSIINVKVWKIEIDRIEGKAFGL